MGGEVLRSTISSWMGVGVGGSEAAERRYSPAPALLASTTQESPLQPGWQVSEVEEGSHAGERRVL